MAVYRVNKSRNYTVMSNFHLRDKNLSLKAVGLLSKMLSFNDGWKFSTRGLSAICKEGPDAILSALRELERHGYLVRHRQRDSKGRLSSTIFDIFEEPQPVSPDTGSPHMENPDMDKPDMDKPHEGNPAQINTNQVITQERNNSLSKYQSINLDGMDGIDERARYEELIRDNLELEILSQDHRFDTDRVNEMVEIMLDAICSTRPTIRINSEDMPQQVVKSRFLKLNSSHIEYVLHAMDECPSDIRNIRAYMLTTLYNASLTIMYSQMFNLLCDKADDEYGGRLPVHVRCLLDEFANIGQIPKFDKLIATIRSREISAAIILQSQSQLKTIYKDAADTIAGNCDCTLFLGGKEKSTLKELSEVLGKETIDLYNTSETRSTNNSYGLNYQKVGKELMSQDEIAVMDGSKCILQLRGVRPFLSDKYDITKHPRYKLLADYDKRNAFDIEKYRSRKLVVKPTDTFDLYDMGEIKEE